MSATNIVISDRAFRPAVFRASTLNEEARSIDVIWSSGATVKRWSYSEGDYLEALDMTPSAVDLGRLNAGASFCDNHQQDTMASRLGAVVPGSARIEKGLGVATIVLSTSTAGEQILADLRAGLPLPISVGYRVSAYEKSEGDEASLPTFTATRWEPMELSAVVIPADPAARARSEPAEGLRHSVPIIVRRAESAAGQLEPEMSDNAETLERTRAAEIMTLSENHNIPLRLARKAVAEGKTLPEFREMALDHKRKEQSKTEIFSIAPMGYDASERSLTERMSDVISGRISRAHKPADDARSLVGLSVPELARRSLEARGTGTAGMAPNQLVERALNTTSDFPAALAMAGQRELVKAYGATPSGLKSIAKATTARDFRPKVNVILAGGGQLLKVNEHGEYRRASFVEGTETYGLSSFGRIFGITRQALVNDDLGVFADLPARFGRAATEFEVSFLANVLEANGKMGDGKAVFHADHKNLAATGSTLSVTSLSAARLAMRQQVDANGDLVSIVPKYLIVPAALETAAEQLLATITATTANDVNPFGGKLELIVEPRLKSATAWYLSADPQQFPSLEYAHLEGEEAPRLDQRVGFDVDGMEFKVALDFGAAIVDFRGLFKNPGA